MMGNILTPNRHKTLYKASFLGKNPKFIGYGERNKAYVYNMSNIIVGGNSNLTERQLTR
jgi:hypothetical protein